MAEELLRWGAPVGHHWVADRQSGPLIAKVGTPDQRERFLPAICRGELSFCIGMSEPDSGSDLASVVTRATRGDDGWIVNGTKVWTTGAHEHDWLIALVRTSDAEDRHAGLSQVLIDLHTPGVEVNPIPFLDGTADFNEVVLDRRVRARRRRRRDRRQRVGSDRPGARVRRGGPDRWLSTYLVLEQYLREHEPAELDAAFVELLGSAAARFWGLRNLSLSVAHAIDAHEQPSVQAALVKEMGTRFEQDLLENIRRFVDVEPVPGLVVVVRAPPRQRHPHRAGVHHPRRHHRDPALRRGQGVADVEHRPVRPLLSETATRVFADTATFAAVEQAEADGWAPTIWDAVAETGLAWVSVPESAGGSGGTLADAIEVVRIGGCHAVPLPLAETGMLGGWLLAGAAARGRPTER